MGIAIGQSRQSANPAFIRRERWYSDWNQLLKLVKEWHQTFLVGLPLNMDDSESELFKFAHENRNAVYVTNQYCNVDGG